MCAIKAAYGMGIVVIDTRGGKPRVSNYREQPCDPLSPGVLEGTQNCKTSKLHADVIADITASQLILPHTG